MIELSIDDAGLLRIERALIALHQDQMPFAIARALNDCARKAATDVNKAMPQIFDRPTAFTERAAIAPRALAASKHSLSATVTLRPIQAKYLTLEETGGTRTGAMNTGKASKNVLLPGKAIALDAHGNIPRGTLASLKRQTGRKRAKSAGPASGPDSVVFLHRSDPGNKGKVAGFFRRLAGRGLTRLTALEPETHYKPHLGYHARVEASVRATWPGAIIQRLHEAIRTAR